MYLINHKGYEVQACCIFLDDVDQFRMRWPSNSKIKVNGNDVKTEGRLGPGGLRDGVLISTYLDEGSNDISFTASPNGIFRLGIRLVKPRTIQEVCSIICNKQDGELLNDATARVIRCVTGGAATLDAAQRELEVLADSAAVDLRCPISGGRMKIASRFRSCIHMACFDLESFLGLAKTTKKWKCPICLQNYSWEDIIIDPYFHHVIRTIEQSGADTAEIKIRADGSWFPSNEASTSRTNSITCDDLSSPQRTPTNHGASLDDPLILSDSD
uniref:SP-RING-type domain-containing protein n=2 Tax=Daucus carota subsp. sativus TaxID=79200 RepID=A0A175YQN8_DAUCS